MGYKAISAFTNMTLAIIDLNPPLEWIYLTNFSRDTEYGNKILNALFFSETILRSLKAVNFGGNPKWWIDDKAKVKEN